MKITTFLILFSQYVSIANTFPYDRIKRRGYILVDMAKKTSKGDDSSKPISKQKRGTEVGICGFRYVPDTETSRIPRVLNVAELTDPTSKAKCRKIWYDFPVLKKCVDCDSTDSNNIIYKISKQRKTIGFIE